MAQNRVITMSIEEIQRSEILRMADERQITQEVGARQPGITEGHFRLLLKRVSSLNAERDHLSASRETRQ